MSKVKPAKPLKDTTELSQPSLYMCWHWSYAVRGHDGLVHIETTIAGGKSFFIARDIAARKLGAPVDALVYERMADPILPDERIAIEVGFAPSEVLEVKPAKTKAKPKTKPKPKPKPAKTKSKGRRS